MPLLRHLQIHVLVLSRGPHQSGGLPRNTFCMRMEHPRLQFNLRRIQVASHDQSDWIFSAWRPGSNREVVPKLCEKDAMSLLVAASGWANRLPKLWPLLAWGLGWWWPVSRCPPAAIHALLDDAAMGHECVQAFITHAFRACCWPGVYVFPTLRCKQLLHRGQAVG